MCCDSIFEELKDFEFSEDDLEGPIYHKDNIASLADVIRSIELFLDSWDFQAYKFFFETASQSHVDLIGWKPYEGIYRRVTQEKAKAILNCCCEWGCDWDWKLDDTLIAEQPWAFDMEQIDIMMNNAVKGHLTPFSIKHLIEQAKSLTNTTLSNDPDIQNINADFDKNSPTYPLELDAALHTRERNTLLKIIAALAIELKIPLNNPYKAGLIIEALTDKLGRDVGVNHKTIALKIKDISELFKLPSN